MVSLELYSLPTSTSGLDQIAIDTIAEVPAFSVLILVFTFFVTFLSGIGMQKARTGTSDYPLWATIASVATVMLTMIMSVTTGILRIDWVVITVVVTIFSAVWLFLDQKPSEL